MSYAIRDQPHTHLISYNVTGEEHGNALYDEPLQAAYDFTVIANQILYPQITVPAEVVFNRLDESGTFWAGNNKMTLLITKCGGGCHSPVWN